MARRQEIGVGALMVVAAAVTAILAVQVGALSGLGSKIDVTVPAPDVAGLQSGAMVSALGVPVGTVTALELAGGQVEVHLSLDPGAGLRADCKPRIRARSLLGEKYVELVPGRDPQAPVLRDGDVLPTLTPQFDVDQLVDVVGPLGESMDPSVFQRLATRLAETIDKDPERLDRMLSDLEILLANSAQASQELPELMVETRATLHDVRDTTVEAQATIAQVDQLLRDLQGTPETAEQARLALGELRSTLADFKGTQQQLDVVLKNLAGLDPEAVSRMLRDEGVRVRLSGPRAPEPPPPPAPR